MTATLIRIYTAILLLISTTIAYELSVLSYNIHGLPPLIANDNPKSRIPKILSIANGYDIILLQENWIFDSDYLEDLLPSYNLVFSSASKFYPVIRDIINSNGAGLVIAVRNTFEIVKTNEILYSSCSGWIDRSNDCLASKGLLHVRVNTGSGLFDIYNTHLDAGIDDFDCLSRSIQVSEIIDYIESTSKGLALVIGGDMNIDYYSDERHVLQGLIDGLGLENVNWNTDSLEDEYIDYLLYRPSSSINLKEVSSKVDISLNGMSDHPPIYVILKY